jgi:hypothetical protein
LELHHLTPSGILHIATFITLCEAYYGIEPHFNLWNYFFRIWLQSDLDAKVVILGCVEVHVWPRQGADLYFLLLVSNPPVGWQRGWFFLRNDAPALLLKVTRRHPAA